MAALVISISSDVSVESVGSSFPGVILIGSIFVEVSVAPEVGVAAVASPTGVLELDTHSSSEADPSESSPPPVSVAPMVLPFLCLDDSEVALRSSSPTTSILKISNAFILPAPSAIEEIPIGRHYRTHLGGPCRALTARKSDRPLPSHRLALRSFISRHTPPDTTDANSSTPPRFVYPPLARTPRCSEAYLHSRFAQLSTMYPPRTSESSTRDFSSESSNGPSRKRCRSAVANMTSSIYATRALVPSLADLLQHRKRFMDSISLEDSVKENINTDVLEDIEADATAIEVLVDKDVKAGVDTSIDMEIDVRVDVEDEVEDEVESINRGAMKVGVDVFARIDVPDGMLMPDAVECLEQVKEGLQDIYKHVMEIPL
uniref:Uncharacterized protein n=1 Tax=Tanacetum cinerariifolium TaxID=118510 RepID=A0A6L2KAF5_TANCI|nr:hypothetical protein [Tanacetum cinerariifolium]